MDTLPPYLEASHPFSGISEHLVDQKTPVRSSFYFPEGNIVFKVENTFFKLWDAPFRRHSRRFCAEQGLPTLDDVLNGDDDLSSHTHKDDASALELSGIRAADFEQLLSILFPPVIGEYRPQDWVAVLHLATHWEFLSIRKLALTHLAAQEIDPVERLVLAYQYRTHPHWAVPGYIALCARTTPLTAIEIANIGTSATAHITTARERLGTRRTNMTAVRRVVAEVLGLPDTNRAPDTGTPVQSALDNIEAGAVAVGEGVRRAFGGVAGLFGAGAGLAPDLATKALPAASGASAGFLRVDKVGSADKDNRDKFP